MFSSPHAVAPQRSESTCGWWEPRCGDAGPLRCPRIHLARRLASLCEDPGPACVQRQRSRTHPTRCGRIACLNRERELGGAVGIPPTYSVHVAIMRAGRIAKRAPPGRLGRRSRMRWFEPPGRRHRAPFNPPTRGHWACSVANVSPVANVIPVVPCLFLSHVACLLSVLQWQS